MTNTGKFFWKDTSAHLAYTADLESGCFIVENLDSTGYDFLHSLEPGKEIGFPNSNGSLKLLITNLEVKGRRVHCQAVVVD